MFKRETESYVLHAYHLYETLKLKEIDRLFSGRAVRRSANRLVFQEGENGFFFIYRFGSVTFMNVGAEARESVINKLKSLIGERPDMLISEEFAVDVGGSDIAVDFDRARIDSLSIDRVEILSLILAQSTALEYFEIKVDDMFGKTADIGHSLAKRGVLERSEKNIKKFMGQCISTKQVLVASLYLLDKPDEIWEDRLLDTLYRESVEMFELKDRYKTVDYKLRMIQENLELIAELLQYRHGNFLEWAIIILIAIEIVLFVFQLFILKT